jgi:hypothetical protein
VGIHDHGSKVAAVLENDGDGGARRARGSGLVGTLPASARDNAHVEGAYSLDATSSTSPHTFNVVAALSPGGVITAVVSDDPATELGQWALDGHRNVVATFYAFETGPNGRSAR